MAPRIVKRTIAAVGIGLLAGGCAATRTLTRDNEARGQVEELRIKIVELQRKAAVSEVEMARLHEKVALLEIAAKRSEAATSSPPERLSFDRAPIDSVPRRGGVEEADLAEPRLEPGNSSGSQEPGPAANAREGSSPLVPQIPVAVRGELEPVTAVAQQLYDEAYALYNKQQLVEAEARFQLFLQRYPDTELSDNAQYWIGEARYGRHDLRGASAAFRETTLRFPSGNKVPDALLKTGQCAEQLGDRAAAREAYREVVRRYPESATAILARELLDKIGG